MSRPLDAAALRDPRRLAVLLGAIAAGALPATGCIYGPVCTEVADLTAPRSLPSEQRAELSTYCDTRCPGDAERELTSCTVHLVVGGKSELHCDFTSKTAGKALAEDRAMQREPMVALSSGLGGDAHCLAACPAGGDGPADGCAIEPAGLMCVHTKVECQGAGRRPRRRRAGRRAARRDARGTAAGRWLRAMAALERASVRAFEELADDLAELGAPRALTEGARASATDERRHTEMTEALATARGARPLRPERRALGARQSGDRLSRIERIARENLREGCVREGFAALLVTYQARAATDREVAVALAEIAADETRHAALSFELHAWAMSELDAWAQRRVTSEGQRALDRLGGELFATASSSALAEVGGPDGRTALSLFSQFRAAIGPVTARAT